MFVNHCIVAEQRYRCRYACTKCNQRNVERGRIRRVDRLLPSDMAPSWQEEVELSGELAQNRAARRFYRLQASVNDRQWYAGLRLPGKCRHCGCRQPWSSVHRHRMALLVLISWAVFVWATVGWPDEPIQQLALLAVLILCLPLAEALVLGFLRHIMRESIKSEDRPIVQAVRPE